MVDKAGEVGASGDAIIGLDADGFAGFEVVAGVFGRIGATDVPHGDAGGGGRGKGVVGMCHAQTPVELQDIGGTGFACVGKAGIVIEVDADGVGGWWHRSPFDSAELCVETSR